ncbi:MAG TPA: tetratricopeptide repeat protein, partial [Bryobacteraceae bacterium]|nr:tetratricopeptide repeat protein [Bryobacteraceae bacterium]
LQPDNPEAANNLAFLLSNGGGSIDEALRLAQQAVQHGHGRPNFFDTLGWIYLKKNMRAAAVQIFSNLVQRDPREPAFYYHLGAALAANGEKDKAREALRVALAKKPSRSDQIKIQELLEHLG